MMNKNLKIAFSGMPDALLLDPNNVLILRIIGAISNSTIKIVDNYKSADMVLVYPYGSGSMNFKFKWVIFQIIKKFTKIKDYTDSFRWIIGVRSKPILFISHENLDRPYWWNTYGALIIKSKIPRLTYWPKIIDPNGARFPYWYNYVEWPDYPRQNFYTRYGKLYDIDLLMSPLKNEPNRIEEVVVVASEIDFPRASILKELRNSKVFKIFGRAGLSFYGEKYPLMKKYKYAFCCENSIGFGYDSEKIPEAWIAGCVPYGVFLNPYSDFNLEALNGFEYNDKQNAYRRPLLKNKPNLTEIEEYVKNFIEEYALGNADLSRRIAIS